MQKMKVLWFLQTPKHHYMSTVIGTLFTNHFISTVLIHNTAYKHLNYFHASGSEQSQESLEAFPYLQLSPTPFFASSP